MILAIAIFLATLTLVIWQPRGLKIGWSALGGALVALATGVVHLGNIPTVWGIVWNATLTFVAVIIISLLLDGSGFFRYAARYVARLGRGNGRWLFVLVVLLGAVIASVFANDGTALILTPIVMEMLLALQFPAEASFAFVIATGFIADTSSLPLVVSNLVNIVSADYFHLGFASYAAVMIPVALAAILASLGVLVWYFHRQIPRHYDRSLLESPRSAIIDPVTFRVGWVMLAVLLGGYFAAAPLGLPISAVAGAAAVVLMAVAGRDQLRSALGRRARRGQPAISVTRIVMEAPWQIVLFSLGMYLVVYGLRNEGLTADIARLLDYFADHGLLASSFGTGALIAVLSSVMNNMPTVLIGALSVHASHAHGSIRQAMIYANVVGADLGPKFTPIGSLATLLWLHVLERRGMKISWGTYFRIGITLTPLVLLITLGALALRTS